MSSRRTNTQENQKRSTEPSYALNHDGDSEYSEQGLSRQDNRYSFNTEESNNFRKNKPSNEVNLSDDELMFDKEALSKNQNRDSFNYINQKIRRAQEGPTASETVFQLLEEEDELAIYDFFRDNSADITTLIDSRGYTVLHIAAYKGLENMCARLIQIAQEKSCNSMTEKERIKKLKNWANIKTTEDEFSALHMAAFSGKFSIVKMLIDIKANIYAVNKDGLNMLHTAAQGDQAFMLYYFKSLDLDINSKDNRGSTPLHWA